MIFEILYLLFTHGSKKAKEDIAAREAKRMLRDETAMRKEFFARKRRYQEDKFTLFGEVGNTNGKDHQWHEALEILDRLESGYFPYSWTFHYPLSNEDLKKSKIKNFNYKVVPKESGDYADIYLKLSDVEDFITYRNSNGRYFMRSTFEEIPQEIRKLLYDGKITIGIPYGQDGNVSCQVMTLQEAREFMQNTMKRRFQNYYKNITK